MTGAAWDLEGLFDDAQSRACGLGAANGGVFLRLITQACSALPAPIIRFCTHSADCDGIS